MALRKAAMVTGAVGEAVSWRPEAAAYVRLSANADCEEQSRSRETGEKRKRRHVGEVWRSEVSGSVSHAGVQQ